MPNDKQIGAHPEWQVAGMRAKAVEHFGPASYNSTTGEVIQASAYSVKQFFIVQSHGGLITDSTGAMFGTVRTTKVIGGNGVPTWTIRYYDTAGTEIANAVDLSGKRTVLEILGI